MSVSQAVSGEQTPTQTDTTKHVPDTNSLWVAASKGASGWTYRNSTEKLTLAEEEEEEGDVSRRVAEKEDSRRRASGVPTPTLRTQLSRSRSQQTERMIQTPREVVEVPSTVSETVRRCEVVRVGAHVLRRVHEKTFSTVM